MITIIGSRDNPSFGQNHFDALGNETLVLTMHNCFIIDSPYGTYHFNPVKLKAENITNKIGVE